MGGFFSFYLIKSTICPIILNLVQTCTTQFRTTLLGGVIMAEDGNNLLQRVKNSKLGLVIGKMYGFLLKAPATFLAKSEFAPLPAIIVMMLAVFNGKTADSTPEIEYLRAGISVYVLIIVFLSIKFTPNRR